MKTFDWLKLAAVLVVMIGGTWRFTQWKADLRFEGQRILYEEMADSQRVRLEAALFEVRITDSIASVKVQNARAASDSAKAEAEAARIRAGRISRERVELVDSILATTEHVEEVRAALNTQADSYEAELAEVRTEVASLRTAEAEAWRAYQAEAKRTVALQVALGESQAQVYLQAAIIERYERTSGHGLLFDGLIAAGGVAVGFVAGGL